jgi:hypothetical protein
MSLKGADGQEFFLGDPGIAEEAGAVLMGRAVKQAKFWPTVLQPKGKGCCRKSTPVDGGGEKLPNSIGALRQYTEGDVRKKR